MITNSKTIQKLVSHYGLKDVGYNRNYINFRCPFHADNDPSCGINCVTGHWHCFGCAKGGTLFNFIYRMEKYNYQQAKEVYALFGFSNYDVEDEDFVKCINIILSSMDEDETKEEEILLDKRVLNNYDVKYDYLIERGLTEETCRYFNIRYSDKWQYNNKASQEKVFSRRIIIPVYNEEDNLIGMVTRSTDGSEPRYLNTSGMKRTLFNINNIYKKEKWEEIIVVEGAIDVMLLHQAGFDNAVCILGSELSDEQFRLLRNKTNRMVLAFDNDQHGKEITERAITKFNNAIDIYIIEILNNKDFGDIKDIEKIREVVNSKEYYLMKYVCV